MGDYWSLTEMYAKDKGKKKNNKGDKDKKGKKKEKEKTKDKKSERSLFEQKKDKTDSMQYGEFLKTRLTGIFEAKIKVKGDKRKAYIYRTEDMKYPNIFMDLQDQNFKDWVIDQIDDEKINPNRIMYSAEITKIDIPKDLFNILTKTNVICVAYAAGMNHSPVPVEDEELDDLIERADEVVNEIKDE